MSGGSFLSGMAGGFSGMQGLRDGRAERESRDALAEAIRSGGLGGGQGGDSQPRGVMGALGGGTSGGAGEAVGQRRSGGSGGGFDPASVGEGFYSGISGAASALQLDPEDLATFISYETAGTFDPVKAGPTTQWGQHRGLIQFGEPQAKKYGVDFSSGEAAMASQLGKDGAIVRYALDHGFVPGKHNAMDLYSTINAGGPGRYGASDANNGGAPGTVRDKYERQMSGHRAKARALAQHWTPAQGMEMPDGAAGRERGVLAAGLSGDAMVDRFYRRKG